MEGGAEALGGAGGGGGGGWSGGRDPSPISVMKLKTPLASKHSAKPSLQAIPYNGERCTMQVIPMIVLHTHTHTHTGLRYISGGNRNGVRRGRPKRGVLQQVGLPISKMKNSQTSGKVKGRGQVYEPPGPRSSGGTTVQQDIGTCTADTNGTFMQPVPGVSVSSCWPCTGVAPAGACRVSNVGSTPDLKAQIRVNSTHCGCRLPHRS